MKPRIIDFLFTALECFGAVLQLFMWLLMLPVWLVGCLAGCIVRTLKIGYDESKILFP